MVVAFLEVRLVTVSGEQFGVGEVAVVADQWEAAVGRGVIGDLVTLSSSIWKVSLKIVLVV